MGNNTDDTPFHLRMTCLHMAKDILAERMHLKKEVAGVEQLFETYQTEDVLAEAAKLYRFVCDKNANVNYARPKG